MVGGDLPTSDDVTIALLTNPALREVTAGSANNREIGLELSDLLDRRRTL